jgi:hypothetical protein
MSVEIEKVVGVQVSSKDFVAGLKAWDVVEFASAVAERFDQDFVNRADVANAFADSLTEQGVRFLAEVVTSFHGRKR